MHTIYLDENLSPSVADALNSLSKGDFDDIKVNSTIQDFGKGIKDEVLIPKIGERKAILITRDINMNRIRVQSDLLKTHKLGVFFIDLPKGKCKHWDIVLLLINNWQDIIQLIRTKHTPYICTVKPKGGVKLLK